MGCSPILCLRHVPAGPSVSLDQLYHLDAVARHLPFAVDDYAAAGTAFARWRGSGTDDDRKTVELWAYCYTLRYFYTQFARERTSGASDLDDAIDRAYGRVLRNLEAVREADKFASFVSVVCKRTLLNHRARRRPVTEVEEHMAPVEPTSGPDGYDGRLVQWMIGRSIEGLPAAIRDIARMRLLDRVPYEEIAEVTGRPLPTVRTYVSKAIARLREDPDLRALYYDDVLPPGLNGTAGEETDN